MTTSDNNTQVGVCRCCLSEGSHRDFTLSYDDVDAPTASECYSDMFYDCYKFPLYLDNATTLICLDCISKLKTAFELKKNVLESTINLSLISVDTKNLAVISPDVAYDLDKEDSENGKAFQDIDVNEDSIHEHEIIKNGNTQEKRFNRLGDIIAVSNINETDITGFDMLPMKFETQDLIGQSEIQEHTDPIISTTDPNSATSNYPSDDCEKRYKFFLDNGFKVTTVKDDQESEDTALIEPNVQAGVDSDNEMPTDSGDTNLITVVHIVDTENQEPISQNNFLENKTAPVREESLLVPIHKSKKGRAKKASNKYALPKKNNKQRKYATKILGNFIELTNCKKSIPVPDNKSKPSKDKPGPKKQVEVISLETKPLNEEIPGWSKPKLMHSYSGKTQCLNKIHVSKPVTIESAEFESLGKHIVDKPTHIEGTSTLNTSKSNSTQEINSDGNIDDIDYKHDNRSTQLVTCMTDKKFGAISFNGDLELDHLPPTKYIDPKVIHVQRIGKQWRLNSIGINLSEEDNDAAPTNQSLISDDDNSEELRAYRERLLSGYVKKTVIIDKTEYAKKIEELSKRLPTAAYKCKACCAVFISENTLIAHKKSHEAVPLPSEQAQVVGGAATNKQFQRTLTAAPGVKVVNQMYKTNNKGLVMIYASGNCFYKSWTTEDKIVWVCRTHHQCTATLHTRDDQVVAYNDSHTPRTNYKPAKNPKPSRAKIRRLNEEEPSKTVDKDTIKPKTNKDGSSKPGKGKPGQSKNDKNRKKVNTNKIVVEQNTDTQGLKLSGAETEKSNEKNGKSAQINDTNKKNGHNNPQSNTATIKGTSNHANENIKSRNGKGSGECDAKDSTSITSGNSLNGEEKPIPKQYLPSPSKKRSLPTRTSSSTNDQIQPKPRNMEQEKLQKQKKLRVDNNSEYSFVINDDTPEHFDIIFEDL